MWRFFQILTHNNFRQTNAINMKFFIKALYAGNNTRNFFPKKRLFQILTHNNYKKTDGIQLEIFAHVLCWEYYSKPKD